MLQNCSNVTKYLVIIHCHPTYVTTRAIAAFTMSYFELLLQYCWAIKICVERGGGEERHIQENRKHVTGYLVESFGGSNHTFRSWEGL